MDRRNSDSVLILPEKVPLVFVETLQVRNSKVQEHSSKDLQAALIVIVNSSEPSFWFLNCSEVHLPESSPPCLKFSSLNL